MKDIINTQQFRSKDKFQTKNDDLVLLEIAHTTMIDGQKVQKGTLLYVSRLQAKKLLSSAKDSFKVKNMQRLRGSVLS